jgi:hypothetical protein
MVDVKGRFVREVHEDEIIFPENVDFAERAHRANRAHIAQAAGGANADANGKGHADDNKSSKQPPPAPRTGVQMTRTAADGTTRTTTLVDSRDSVERRFHIALDELGMATPHGDLVVYKAAGTCARVSVRPALFAIRSVVRTALQLPHVTFLCSGLPARRRQGSQGRAARRVH